MLTITIEFKCKYNNGSVEHTETSSVDNLADVKNVATNLINNIVHEGLSSYNSNLRSFNRNEQSLYRDPFRHRSNERIGFIPASRFTPDRYSYRGRDQNRAFKYLSPLPEKNSIQNITLDLTNIPVDVLSTKMQDIANEYIYYKETILYTVPVIGSDMTQQLDITLSVQE